MSGYDATPVELRVCGSMLAQINNEVHAELRVLKGEVAALLSGGWQGSAAEGFAQGWEQWHAGANDVLEALATMGRLLGTTGQNYELVDEDSARREWESGAGL